MKILHLIESGGLYGMERILLDLAVAQREQGDTPIIVSVGPPDAPEKAVEQQAQDRNIEVKPWRMKAGLNILGMREIMQWGASQNIDVFHAHGYRFDALLTCADPLGRHPKVSTQHGLTQKRDGSLRWTQRFGLACLRSFDKVIFVAEGLRDRYGDHLKNTTVIPNGIDLRPLQQVRQTPTPPSSGQIELVAIGRLAFEKNYSLLLEVVKHLSDREVPCRLTQYGDGKLRTELEDQAKQLGLTNVKFAGYTNEVFKKLHAADALVFTSRSEGMPVTVIEAMSLGVPIISTAVGGIPEMLKGYPLGRITSETAPSALADLVMEVCQPNERQRASADSIQLVESRYSAQNMAQSYRSVYETLLASR